MSRVLFLISIPQCVLLTWFSLPLLLVTEVAIAAPRPDDATIYIQVYYEKDNISMVVDQGTGFLVNSRGWVVTAKHLIEAPVPTNFERKYRGAITSNTNNFFELFKVPGTLVSADAGLLMFSPQLPQKWPYLKILSEGAVSIGDKIEGWGFPGKEMSFRPGVITSVAGPQATVEVNAGFSFGMSGGPVLLEGTRCVIGVITGGTGFAGFDYFTPIRYVRPLLEEAEAEFVSISNVHSACNKETIPGYYDYMHPLVTARTVGEYSNVQVSFNVPDKPSNLNANLITLYTFRITGGTYSDQAGFQPVTGQWSGGDVATLSFTIPSAYFKDVDRQLHYCIGTQQVCLPGPDLLHYDAIKRD